MARFDLILPAGGRIDGEFARQVGTEWKALIEFEGRTILERQIDAFRASGVVDRIAVIGPEELLASSAAQLADLRVQPGETGPDNIYRGLDALHDSDAERVLVATTDLPFLSPSLITDFVERCPADRDICVPLISQSSYAERFPGSTATFVRIKDGIWTLGCMYQFHVQSMRRIKPAMDRVFENRKSKLGMARILGPGFVMKYLMKSLTVPELESKVGSILGCTAYAMPDSAPELAFDIDAADDYEYAMTSLVKI